MSHRTREQPTNDDPTRPIRDRRCLAWVNSLGQSGYSFIPPPSLVSNSPPHGSSFSSTRTGSNVAVAGSGVESSSTSSSLPSTTAAVHGSRLGTVTPTNNRTIRIPGLRVIPAPGFQSTHKP